MSTATGFLVTFNHNCYLITNMHVFRTAAVAGAETTSVTALRGKKQIRLNPRKFAVSPKLDCAIVGLLDSDGFLSIPLEAPLRALHDGELIFILGHPSGHKLSFSHGPNTVIKCVDHEVYHVAATEGGSSGSPIFNKRGQLVALHSKARKSFWTGGYKYNIAFNIVDIIGWVEKVELTFATGSDALADSISGASSSSSS
eukprot:TRINITY_DN3543_c0_g1_i3.p1 TRINITY_DN3543_c0_g1~~TRINITY_DN3543_c0_g1_i3.p1  ORF type:complete len:199 (+),score=27.06 TRINITY_DN3543_c0_g1_i3:410-1006(+)